MTLAASGAVGSVLLITLVPESRRWPWNTVGQLAVLALLLEFLGRRSVRRWLDAAEQLKPGEEGSGEPTALWTLPLIVTGLTAVFVLLPHTGLPGTDRAGWDAGLRITGGCALVGLAQGVRYACIVAADEQRRGRRYVRVPGSRILRGTKLGFTRAS